MVKQVSQVMALSNSGLSDWVVAFHRGYSYRVFFVGDGFFPVHAEY